MGDLMMTLRAGKLTPEDKVEVATRTLIRLFRKPPSTMSLSSKVSPAKKKKEGKASNHSPVHFVIDFSRAHTVRAFNKSSFRKSQKQTHAYYSETCEIRTTSGQDKSVVNSEVSSFHSAICTENSSLEPDKVSLFCRVAIHRFHCTMT
jgi:hypothetical protein